MQFYLDQSYREDPSTFSYIFDVPNGGYDVILSFREPCPSWMCGSRVFDIYIEGALVFENVTINDSLELLAHAVVADKQLNIDFVKDASSVRGPMLSAIQIEPSDADLDHDGQTKSQGDCNDEDPFTYRGAPERREPSGQERDNDCDGNRYGGDWIPGISCPPYPGMGRAASQPLAPLELQVTDWGDEKATLTWKNPNTVPVAGYGVFYDQNSMFPLRYVYAPQTTYQFTPNAWFNPLPNGSPTSLMVGAYDQCGQVFAWSNPVTVTPQRAELIGPIETVMDWRTDKCEQWNQPNLPVSAYRDAENLVNLIIPHFVNYRMRGPDFDHLTSDCANGPILTSDYDSDPSRYNYKEWLSSVFTMDGSTVWGLIHEEFHGEDVPGQCPSGKLEKCHRTSITAANSQDGGRHFVHDTPPLHYRVGLPVRYVPDWGYYGLMGPKEVYNSHDGFYYMAFTAFLPAGAGGVCLAQAANPDGPWLAWSGTAFTLPFLDPYQGAFFKRPDQPTCMPVYTTSQGSGTMGFILGNLAYNTALHQWVMTLANIIGGGDGSQFFGYARSYDLIHWSTFTHLMYVPGDPPINYPALIDHTSLDRNFTTSGLSPFLYWSKEEGAHTNELWKEILQRQRVRLYK